MPLPTGAAIRFSEESNSAGTFTTYATWAQHVHDGTLQPPTSMWTTVLDLITAQEESNDNS